MLSDSDVTDQNTTGRRSVLGRAFEILDCFAVDSCQTISSLCEQTGLPPATVHRMLASLVEWGAVERASRGQYRLGRRLWRLGVGVPEVRQLRDVARPVLVDLHTAARNPVLLVTVEDDTVQINDVIAGRAHNSFRHHSRMQGRSGAPAMVYAAFSTRPVDEALDFTQRQQIGAVRRNGFAVVPSQGYTWVSAPIFDAEGLVRSSLCIVLPSDLTNPAAFGRLVVKAAREISAGLGHRRSQTSTSSAQSSALA